MLIERMSSFVAGGLALAALGYLGRHAMRQKSLIASSVKYYKGGFEPVMTKREASLILGVSPNSDTNRIKQAHKRIMLLNHPDRGGSPYVASKVNSAKDILLSDHQ